MLKSIYLEGGILGAVAFLVIGCVSRVPTETTPTVLSRPTASSTFPSLQPNSGLVLPPTAYDIALAVPYLGDKIPRLPRSA
jgi:hypothetical protein